MKTEIAMKPVKSSNIDSVGFCQDSNTMAVRFKSGGTYHYQDVNEEVYTGMVNAKSVGKHYHNKIRGSYKGEKV